ncbi:transcription elongation factor GreA [Atopobium fossor]|uniref:transcription elongation factor GreA n=1 Tax=Atopobium fossor TaxID=39487 RepID=UPI0003FE50E5|nr:transcription elongation factor GreA [Atopobium fossor]
MDKEIILTPEGRQKLVDELEWREGEKHAEIIVAIKEAREQGDLSENAEYDAAKEEEAQNAARIAEIRKILSTAKLAEATTGRATIVSIGSTVEVSNEKGKKSSYTIVGTTETDSLSNRISNESPVGAALIGAKIGETVEYVTPSGKTRTLKVEKISR